MSGKPRPPGRGLFVSLCERYAPDALRAAWFIAAREKTFTHEIPDELRGQFAQLQTRQLVDVAPDGFIFRARGHASLRGTRNDLDKN